MSEYNRDRVARLFDGIADEKNAAGKQASRAGKNIPQLAGQVALERLELSRRDVLTGRGNRHRR